MNDQVDHSRRRLLTAATVGTGAIGAAFAAVPFITSWLPSERAKALGAPVEVDASKLEAGQMLKVVWRGQPVFVVRRTKAVVDALGGHDDLLADPTSADSLQPDYIKGAARARNPEYWVGLAVCTHLGLLAAGRVRTECSDAIGGHRSGPGLAGRVLLPLPWVEIRYIRPRLQVDAGAEEPHGSFLHDLRGCAHCDWR
jgi:ubiquinol-cytochrome c reductase iron-sulfur subunit